jgi:hypothetical protein
MPRAPRKWRYDRIGASAGRRIPCSVWRSIEERIRRCKGERIDRSGNRKSFAGARRVDHCTGLLSIEQGDKLRFDHPSENIHARDNAD